MTTAIVHFHALPRKNNCAREHILFIYSKYINENGELSIYKLDDEFYCFNAIYLTKALIVNTNLNTEHPTYFLPEGRFADTLDEIQPVISEQEYLTYWHRSVAPYLHDWRQLQAKYTLGQKFQTKIVCFYPQGVIVKFGANFYGLADYDACVAILGSTKMYPHASIGLYIEKFDDDNLWIIFSPQKP